MKHEVHGDGSESLFWHCPGCKAPHSIFVKPGTLNKKTWLWNGSVDKCTLSPSVVVFTREYIDDEDPSFRIAPTNCHVFIRDGMIEFLSDCTHALAGKTVPVP